METMASSSTACPVCSGKNTTIDFVVSASEAAQHFVLREGNPERSAALEKHISSLWGQNECTLRHCVHCGFRFADPYIAGDKLFYNLAFERSNYPSDKWEFARTVTELGKMGFRGNRILEIGAGFGLFLDKIADSFVPKSGITAIEFSDAAISSLRTKGYTAHQTPLQDAEFTGPFDAIFAFQVLEHLDGLDDLFSRVNHLLTDNGSFFIAVPNFNRNTFNEENGSLLDMPPNHLGQWTPKALEIIGERHGFRVDATEFEPFSLGAFIKQDIIYSYLRQAQRAGTIENWSYAHRSAKMGKWLGAAVAAALAPRRVGVWAKAAQTPDLGGSLWARFTKVSTSA